MFYFLALFLFHPGFKEFVIVCCFETWIFFNEISAQVVGTNCASLQVIYEQGSED